MQHAPGIEVAIAAPRDGVLAIAGARRDRRADLDDGKREEFRKFAEDAGIGCMTRDDNKHAKAGNINRALERLDSPFVCIFDCDHVPTRSFLQPT